MKNKKRKAKILVAVTLSIAVILLMVSFISWWACVDIFSAITGFVGLGFVHLSNKLVEKLRARGLM